MRSTLNTKQNYCDRSDQVWYVMKTKHDNDMIDRIGLIYVEIETELLGPSWPDVICCENQIGERCGQSYKCILHRKWY